MQSIYGLFALFCALVVCLNNRVNAQSAESVFNLRGNYIEQIEAEFERAADQLSESIEDREMDEKDLPKVCTQFGKYETLRNQFSELGLFETYSFLPDIPDNTEYPSQYSDYSANRQFLIQKARLFSQYIKPICEEGEKPLSLSLVLLVKRHYKELKQSVSKERGLRVKMLSELL